MLKQKNQYPKHRTAIAPPFGVSVDAAQKDHLERGVAVYRNLVAVLSEPNEPGHDTRLYEARHAVTEWEAANSNERPNKRANVVHAVLTYFTEGGRYHCTGEMSGDSPEAIKRQVEDGMRVGRIAYPMVQIQIVGQRPFMCSGDLNN